MKVAIITHKKSCVKMAAAHLISIGFSADAKILALLATLGTTSLKCWIRVRESGPDSVSSISSLQPVASNQFELTHVRHETHGLRSLRTGLVLARGLFYSEELLLLS